MSVFENTIVLKRIAIAISVVIVSLILWNTFIFFQKFKTEERLKMEIIAIAQKQLNNLDLEADAELSFAIISSNNNIPMILVDQDGNILKGEEGYRNLDSIKAKKPNYLKRQLEIMKRENTPIEISYKGKSKQYIYYRNSDLLNRLSYYPLALILIIVLFLTVIYMFFNTSKVSEQNKLWTGMAKETAHQIGTPLSSLLGWIAILKQKHTHDEYIEEIEKDVERLNTIANRFSKIGSVPELKQVDIVAVTKTSFDYLERRSSKQIAFHFINKINGNTYMHVNTELFSWVIENLIKNSVDAMKGKGVLTLQTESSDKKVKITVSDTGKGIPRSLYKKIFKPGFTTKKRGWGLGLSLSKRIIEDYHKGKIFVLKSETSKGTSIQIQLYKVF
ncbi:MAG: sensor histidine kinase [Flavobacteriaceae bacterium]|nr:MAG: sensor histidine kinase [Flavobacteriaceae bacterium]